MMLLLRQYTMAATARRFAYADVAAMLPHQPYAAMPYAAMPLSYAYAAALCRYYYDAAYAFDISLPRYADDITPSLCLHAAD